MVKVIKMILRKLTEEEINKIAEENYNLSNKDIVSSNEELEKIINREKEEERQIRIEKYLQNPTVPEIHRQYN